MNWRPIETAPKDGTHILVASGLDFDRFPPTVAHWFDGGWHLSWNKNGDDSDYNMQLVKLWHPIPQ